MFDPENLSLPQVRAQLGQVWGLDRDVTLAELARALGLSPKYGGDHLSKVERGKTVLTGPLKVAILMMLDGGKPYTMESVIKPGYPRPRRVEHEG